MRGKNTESPRPCHFLAVVPLWDERECNSPIPKFQLTSKELRVRSANSQHTEKDLREHNHGPKPGPNLVVRI